MINGSVIVGMSGGLDSTIAAYRLLKDGYHVTGVYFRSWKWNNSYQDLQNDESWLKTISSTLGIKILTVDRRDFFQKYVVHKYIQLIEDGFTPNPCVICNPYFKFTSLIQLADELQIEDVATGHYAIIKKQNDEWKLYIGKDRLKDQSYMLCLMNQRLLERTKLPLGPTTKKENRMLSEEIGLDFSSIPESQDLCFANHFSHNLFVKQIIKKGLIPGVILDVKGNQLGKHEGLALYTIGQRKGIKISSEKPYYVVEKDLENNILIVGHKDDLGFSRMVLDSINWISRKNKYSLKCEVKIRYHSKSHFANIEKIENNNYLVTFNNKIPDLTPGQYAVLYDHDEMLGGGMILKVLE